MLSSRTSFRVQVNLDGIDAITGIRAVLTVAETTQAGRLRISKQTEELFGDSVSFTVFSENKFLVGVVGFEASKNAFFVEDGVAYEFAGAGIQSFKYVPGKIQPNQVLTFGFSTDVPLLSI